MDGGPGDRGARDGLGRYPWVVMGIVLVATYMVVLDTTVLGVALPRIAEDLDDAPGLSIDWVLITYLVAVAATQPATGWMADRFGRRNVYLAALGLFVLGSALSGFAPTRPVLVVARVVQGAGGGVMMPVGMAMVYELFPPHRRGRPWASRGSRSWRRPPSDPRPVAGS
ncbi:MAG: MFS transporter [Acidimicrobiia bacterium]|nr:MFS transporter [Acidimicrobiia bacterium]